MPLVDSQLSADSLSLLKVVAEDMKLPLVQIARTIELGRLIGNFSPESLSIVEQGAVSALELLDNYMLGLKLAEHQEALKLEPVCMASVLYDTATSLSAFAKQRHVEIELQVDGSYAPVMAHQSGLQAALVSLGRVIIEAQPQNHKLNIVKLSIHRTNQGTAAGIYSDIDPISPSHLRNATQLSGKARQPLNWFSNGSASGIFMAQSILLAMAGRLRTSRYHKQAGLAVVLKPSLQLQLV